MTEEEPDGADRRMYFQLRCITADFYFGDQQFTVSSPDKKMSLVLRKRVQGDADRPELQDMDGFVTVTCERAISQRLYEDVLSSRKLSHKKGAVVEAQTDMYAFMLRVLGLIRWRSNSVGRHHPIRMGLHEGFRWSFDGKEWTNVSDSISATLTFHVLAAWNPDLDQFLATEVGKLDEPIGHVLLREAWTNRTENLRSSVVLAVAAAEVGFKQFASRTLPDVAWILESIPSPPVVKMLSEFPWHRLKVRIAGEPLKPPASVVEELRKAVLLRNNIVHGRAESLTQQTVASIIDAIRDLLYFLDVAQGHGWALSHLSAEARKEFPKSPKAV